MKTLFVLFSTAFLASALTAQAAPTTSAKKVPPPPPIPISSLPFTISAPGTYVLTSNLNAPIGPGGTYGILINSGLPGPVILDLKGFNLIGPDVQPGGTYGIAIGQNATPNTYPITVRNGTIQDFEVGVYAHAGSNLLQNITIDHIAFVAATGTSSTDQTYGVQFNEVISSTISNCTFRFISGFGQGTSYGIWDQSSLGGNNYANNVFSAIDTPLIVTGDSGDGGGGFAPLNLSNCQFLPPPTP